MALKITDLPVDALSRILASVGKSSNGAADIAKSVSVCKRFLEAGKSNIVYKVVCFKKIKVFRHHLFQRTDGLLYNCASAGNLYAQFLLAQVVLRSSTQLRYSDIKSARLKYFRNYRPGNIGSRKSQKVYLAASFLARFTPGQGFHPFLPHWELVKLFLCNCTRSDFFYTHRDLQCYVEYFTDRRTYYDTDAEMFLSSLYSMSFMDMRKPHNWLFTRFYNFMVFNKCTTLSEWLFEREPYIRNAKDLVEGMRMKALHDFDRVSRVFPGFVVPKRKK